MSENKKTNQTACLTVNVDRQDVLYNQSIFGYSPQDMKFLFI